MIVYEDDRGPDPWVFPTFHRQDGNVGDRVAREVDAGSYCFHCACSVSLPVIEWLGPPSRDDGESVALMFHPACAVEFSISLLRDVHEIECRMHTGLTFREPVA